MPKYSQYNIVYRLQKWMDSVAGQTFMNYAYSWGASVVILGTLFKLTHLPGADIMLFLGMGTEVFVFFISAFDRPFDKTQEGMELETSRSHHEGEPVPEGQVAPGVQGVTGVVGVSGISGEAVMPGVAGVQGGGVGGTIVIGGGGSASAGSGQPYEAVQPSATTETPQGSAPFVIGGINGPMTPAPAVSQETAEEMEEATKTYIERLADLNETLQKVTEMSKKLRVDSEEMENLNRTLTGIAKVYEMQLKAASQQIGTQDEINARIKQMADQMTELNKIYARMIEAMTTNIPAVGGMK